MLDRRFHRELPEKRRPRRGWCQCAIAGILLVGVVLATTGCRIPERISGVWSRWSKRDAEGPRATMNGGWIEPDVLADDRWSEVIERPGTVVEPNAPRWRHPTLEELYARPDYTRPDLSVHLNHKDPIIQANAAIGLARWGDARAAEPLARSIAAPQLSLRLRRAAIEALADMQQPSPVPALRELMAQYGHFPPTGRMTYVPELHVELLVALGRHVDATEEGCFQSALRNPNATVRAEALRAWARSRCTELPLEVVDLRADPLATIRAEVLKAISARRHPGTIEFARQGLADFELVVRQAAVAALAHHGGAEAHFELRKVLSDDSELLRAEAVAALAQMGARDDVLEAASDKSWRVRKNVALALGRFPDRASASFVLGYLADPSAEVRQAALAAVEQWPLAAAGPILLAALDVQAYQTRQDATAQLARRWPAARMLSADLPADRKPVVIGQLRQQWTLEFGQVDTEMLARATAPDGGGVKHAAAMLPQQGPPDASLASHTEASQPAPVRLTAEQIAWLGGVLAQLPPALPPGSQRPPAVMSLEELGPQLVDVLEQYAVVHGRMLPEVVYRDLLSRRSPEFALVDALRSDDVEERRRQIARLAERAAQAPLRPLVIERLATKGVTEADGLVWRSMLAAIDNQASEPAVRLLLAGLSHPSPEVRRLAIEALGRRRDPQYAGLLVPALSDPHVSVQREAVRALGQPGMLPDAAMLLPMLASRDRVVRIEAAAGLLRNNSQHGLAALERLAADHDSEVRRMAAVAMGESGRSEFVPTLIRLLSDAQGPGVRRAALEALPRIVGQDVSVPAGEPLPSQVDRIALWRRWWENQP